MKSLTAAIVACILVVPSAALAHRAWLLPSSTILSGDSDYVTVDAALSNDLFYFDHHAMRLDGLTVTGPAGGAVEVENKGTGKFRSTFDVPLASDGTYRLALVSDGLTASYSVGGERKRWRGSAEKLASEIPKDASDLKVTHAQRRMETFVTRGKPTEVKLSGAGLEMEPITHPNDLVAGQPAKFKLMLDGKPAADSKVEVVPGGGRYRDKVGEFSVTTGADGTFEVKWPGPGMYWMEAVVEDDKPALKEAKKRRSSYAATLEVMPE